MSQQRPIVFVDKSHHDICIVLIREILTIDDKLARFEFVMSLFFRNDGVATNEQLEELSVDERRILMNELFYIAWKPEEIDKDHLPALIARETPVYSLKPTCVGLGNKNRDGVQAFRIKEIRRHLIEDDDDFVSLVPEDETLRGWGASLSPTLDPQPKPGDWYLYNARDRWYLSNEQFNEEYEPCTDSLKALCIRARF